MFVWLEPALSMRGRPMRTVNQPRKHICIALKPWIRVTNTGTQWVQMLTVQMLLKNNSSEWPECATCYTAMHVYIMAYGESTWVWKKIKGVVLYANLIETKLIERAWILEAKCMKIWIHTIYLQDYNLWTVFTVVGSSSSFQLFSYYLVLEFSSFCFFFIVFAALLTTSDYILSHNCWRKICTLR
jgi:hypothetical protein